MASDQSAPSQDGSAAWIAERLRPWVGWLPVGAIVPNGFERYARLLHPVGLTGAGQVPWSAVAEWSGRALTATSYFSDIGTRPDGARWLSVGPPPATGQPDPELVSKLAGILEGFTSTPGICWFCVWSGWGDILVDQKSLVDILPSFRGSGRRYARRPRSPRSARRR